MDKERKAQIDWCLNNETNAPETQEWRDELTPEEQEYVDQQDNHFERAIAAMCSARLVVERLRKKYKPEELLELKTFGDHCRVRLRSGEQYMARLGKDGGLVLERA
jgi:hypothetical protein